MMSKENKTQELTINLWSINKKLKNHKIIFIVAIPIVFICSYLIMASYPRFYSTSTKLAPEIGNSNGAGGAMSSIASSLGIDISDIQSTDAITPLLYPELMEDNKFVANILNTPIKTINKKISCNYSNYLQKYQQYPWWSNLLGKKDKEKIWSINNPYALTKKQNKMISEVRDNIKISVNSKNGVITITTTDQDPLVCKILADSVTAILKKFITNYRTNKAKADYAYYKKLTTQAKSKYEKARINYSSYSDANKDVLLQSIRSKLEDMENDMQLKYNEYSSLNIQLQQANAKIQEKTPVFTLIKGADVPIKPAGPKRVIPAFAITLLVVILLSIIILRKDIVKIFA